MIERSRFVIVVVAEFAEFVEISRFDLRISA